MLTANDQHMNGMSWPVSAASSSKWTSQPTACPTDIAKQQKLFFFDVLQCLEQSLVANQSVISFLLFLCLQCVMCDMQWFHKWKFTIIHWFNWSTQHSIGNSNTSQISFILFHFLFHSLRSLSTHFQYFAVCLFPSFRPLTPVGRPMRGVLLLFGNTNILWLEKVYNQHSLPACKLNVIYAY